MSEFCDVQLRISTREALNNLFGILQIAGKTFDERLFGLASMCFSARADIPSGRQTLRARRSADGRMPRKQIEIKQITADEVMAMHRKMFPFLQWVSWDWMINELLKAAEAGMAAGRLEGGEAPM
jgi:hypothetical protein